MNAREKFEKGDRVKFEAETDTTHMYKHLKHATGIVTGYGHNKQTVVVQIHGQKSRTSWHMDYWTLTRRSVENAQQCLQQIRGAK